MSNNWSPADTFASLTGTSDRAQGELDLVVVFTTLPDTIRALKHAGVMAQQLGMQIRTVVAHTVPYPLPIDRPNADPNLTSNALRVVCEAQGIQTVIDVRLCRDSLDGIRSALLADSIILMGGREQLFSRARRWAKDLRRAGHQVAFVARTRD